MIPKKNLNCSPSVAPSAPTHDPTLRPRSQPGTPPHRPSPCELYIGGAGVARGGLSQPTGFEGGAVFVRIPFFREQEWGTGNREWGTGNFPTLYSLLLFLLPLLTQTGDRARYQSRRHPRIPGPHGRPDQTAQATASKPGEIEAALGQHPQVEQAVVVLRDDLGERRSWWRN